MPITAINNHRYNPTDADYPAISTFNATPSDADELPVVCRSFYAGSAGTVVLVDTKGNESTFTVFGGHYFGNGFYKKLKATGTTATGIVAHE